MTWKTIDDKKILAGLSGQERTCVRVVMLNSLQLPTATTVDDYFDKGIGGMMDSAFDRKYEIHAYRTHPATAAVYEKNSGELIGAYVWGGQGSEIVTARDHRMRILADLLDAHFHESGAEINQDYEAESTCECCGDTYALSEGNETHVADIDLGDGVRMEKRELEIKDLFVIIGRYGTDPQLTMMNDLLELGAQPAGIENLRPLGGEAIGYIVIKLTGPYGESFDILPTGKLEADF